ncbi:MAG: 50S ribosomal protein L21 [Deltaproteobacteria bacterium]|nr:50S ribosomal protein L21 [Deltaproteobacteria bacterium]
MYAVIATGGKQYRVAEGDRCRFEKVTGEAGQTLTFDQVLMIGGNGSDPKIGTPQVAGATVEAEILQQGKAKKILVFKKKKRKGYQKRRGHRQQFTEVRITKIAG